MIAWLFCIIGLRDLLREKVEVRFAELLARIVSPNRQRVRLLARVIRSDNL